MPVRTNLFGKERTSEQREYAKEKMQEYVLDQKGVSVLGHERSLVALSIDLDGQVEVALGDGTILKRGRREESIRISVLLNHLRVDHEEDLSPDFTDS